jgi:Xaa-Pro dipeptidase
MSSEFPRAEYGARWRRAREALAAAGLDALPGTSETNYRSLSGHYTGSWLSKSRPMWLLLPRDGEPSLRAAGPTSSSPAWC